MHLYLKGHSFVYELENVMRSFLRDVTIVRGRPGRDNHDIDYAFVSLAKTSAKYRLLCVVKTPASRMSKEAVLDNGADEAELEYAMACVLYDVMCSAMRIYPAWGIVTGIRPAKFAAALLAGGASEREAEWILSSRHRVSANKAGLAVETAKNGMRLAKLNMAKSYSLYISIPFCPTRCSYCSFVSKTVERDRGIIDTYLEKLCAELAHTADIAKELGLKLESIYIGGGTPTVLSEAQLNILAGAVSTNFTVRNAREYTVEAGRPDTITAEKLAVLKKAGVTRISINPQTGDDEVLKEIGRGHTAKDIEAAFDLARRAGFKYINADIIAGLPRDSMTGLRRTLQWLLELCPENITLHSLTLKRSSNLNEYGGNPSRDATEMISYGGQALTRAGYLPYYMYKQKGTVDALENTGYAKPGTECLYNVYMMDELHTVLACGAGAVTKLVNQTARTIQRVYNYKYPAEYIGGITEMILRKDRIKEFYEGAF